MSVNRDRDQELGIRKQESGMRSQISGFRNQHHVFTGQELEDMWEVVSLAASENTAKRMYKAFYEIDKAGA